MTITCNIKHSPKLPCMVSCYTHSSIERMKQNIEKNRKVNISVRRRTKTTIDISLWFDEDSFAVAHIPTGAERFKFVEASQYSFFDSASETRYYFRISKKQNLPELKEYLELVLKELNLSLETLVVDMNIIGIDELKAA